MPEGVRSAACGYPGARHTFCFGASSRAVASFDVQTISFARGVGTTFLGGLCRGGNECGNRGPAKGAICISSGYALYLPHFRYAALWPEEGSDGGTGRRVGLKIR